MTERRAAEDVSFSAVAVVLLAFLTGATLATVWMQSHAPRSSVRVLVFTEDGQVVGEASSDLIPIVCPPTSRYCLTKRVHLEVVP